MRPAHPAWNGFLLLARVHGLSAWRRMGSFGGRSRLTALATAAFVAAYGLIAFSIFHLGLRFVMRFPGLGSLMVERLLFLLFAFLMVLLLLSNVVIAYGNLFRNRETAFLTSLPVPVEAVFTWKVLEGTLLASWAFVFLVAPLLAAYGVVQRVPWHFYPFTLGLVALFAAIPGAIGAATAIGVARHLDRKAFQVGALLVVGALVLVAARGLRTEEITDEQLEARALAVVDRLLSNTRAAQSPFLPSQWLSASIQGWGEGALRTAAFYGLVLAAHSLLLGRLACSYLAGAFPAAASAVHGRASVLAGWGWFQRREARRRSLAAGWNKAGPTIRPNHAVTAGGPWLPKDPLDAALRWLGLRPETRAIIAKDFRMFWRDTTQWGQSVLLFGLLAGYIINLRHFSRQLDSAFWVSLVSYLNLGACALNLATLTTRFVFPQFSLEGRRVWLLGLAPMGLGRAVRIQFWTASWTTLALTVGLTILSGSILRLGPARILYFVGAMTVMTFTLNAIATGLGVLFPNLRETQPAKIVSGFGGTLCLVLSFVYIVAAVVVLAVGSPWGWREDAPHPTAAAGSWLAFVLVSALAGWLPLRIALRRAAQPGITESR